MRAPPPLAPFCIAIAAFRRIGEFIWTAADWRSGATFHRWHITRGPAILLPHGASSETLLLTLPASKIDPFRQGITLTIAAAGDTACAVTTLRNYTT